MLIVLGFVWLHRDFPEYPGKGDRVLTLVMALFMTIMLLHTVIAMFCQSYRTAYRHICFLCCWHCGMMSIGHYMPALPVMLALWWIRRQLQKKPAGYRWNVRIALIAMAAAVCCIGGLWILKLSGRLPESRFYFRQQYAYTGAMYGLLFWAALQCVKWTITRLCHLPSNPTANP